jgi:hypothetical protein
VGAPGADGASGATGYEGFLEIFGPVCSWERESGEVGKGGELMKRMLTVLAVALVMAAMWRGLLHSSTHSGESGTMIRS